MSGLLKYARLLWHDPLGRQTRQRILQFQARAEEAQRQLDREFERVQRLVSSKRREESEI